METLDVCDQERTRVAVAYDFAVELGIRGVPDVKRAIFGRRHKPFPVAGQDRREHNVL
jgi:hypothetical protein